jgi:PAS domain S-box-containing protein
MTMTSSTDDQEIPSAGPHALRDNGQLFRLLVNSIKDYSIYVLDAGGRVATWNPGAQQIKGYTPEEIIGKPYEIFFPATDRAEGKPQRILSQAIRDGSCHDEGWRVRKDGSTFWASATLTVLRDEAGQVAGFAKVTHDDT